MKVHRRLTDFPTPTHTILTSGTFDGVHLGHQKILNRLAQLKQQHPQAQTVVLTYEPHPRLVLFPNQHDLRLLTTLDEKATQIEKLGIDHLCIIPFDKAFAATSSQDFIQTILIDKLQTKQLVIGYDHRFGRNREGGFEYLKENQDQFGFSVEEISRQDIEDSAISSTRIRKALFEGDLQTANTLLGYRYLVSGNVEKGQQIGRKIGYPTANLAIDNPYKLIPAQGIYAVWVEYDKQFFKGMLSIGVRPTIGENLHQTIEVNIFDFDKEIYGEHLTLHFVEYLRPEEKYDSLEALTKQLAQDKINTLTVLK